MSAPFGTLVARRRGFLVPADLAAGLLTIGGGALLLGATWGEPLAVAGAVGTACCWLVGGKWVWEAVRAPSGLAQP